MTTATMTPVSEAAATSTVTPVKIRNRSSVLLIMLFAMLSMTCNYFAYRALFAKRRILRSLRGSSDDADFQPGHQRAQMIEEEDILNDMIMKEMLEAATATATATTTDADADSISNPANRGYYYSQEETTASSSSSTSFSSRKN